MIASTTATAHTPSLPEIPGCAPGCAARGTAMSTDASVANIADLLDWLARPETGAMGTVGAEIVEALLVERDRLTEQLAAAEGANLALLVVQVERAEAAEAANTELRAALEAQSGTSPDVRGVQRDVEDFHRALDIPIGDTPAIRRPELRAALIEEEAAETCAAIRRGDLIEAIDGFCDVLCVIYGAAAEFGVDLAPFWVEVHRTNMAKVGGPVREDGKRLKPEGWTPPDLARVLAKAEAKPLTENACDLCLAPAVHIDHGGGRWCERCAFNLKRSGDRWKARALAAEATLKELHRSAQAYRTEVLPNGSDEERAVADDLDASLREQGGSEQLSKQETSALHSSVVRQLNQED